VPVCWQATKKPERLAGLRVPVCWRTAKKSAINGELHRPAGLLLPVKPVHHGIGDASFSYHGIDLSKTKRFINRI